MSCCSAPMLVVHLHAGQCWWVSALRAGGYLLCLLVGLCSVCSNAGGISALHRAGQCWGGVGGICMLDKTPCCTMPPCTMLHAGEYLLCMLVGTCSACSNAGGISALHCAAPCWTKGDFPLEPQKQHTFMTRVQAKATVHRPRAQGSIANVTVHALATDLMNPPKPDFKPRGPRQAIANMSTTWNPQL